MSPGYLARVIVVAVITLIGSAWFSYDGFVSYPRQRHIALAYQVFQQENRVDQWPDHALAQGWPVTPEAPKSQSDILLQRILGLAALPLGLLFSLISFRSVGRWTACDDTGIQTSTGLNIPYASITRIDKKRWQKKGIVVVHYKHEDKTGCLVLDDWKYNAQATETILRTLEEKTELAE